MMGFSPPAQVFFLGLLFVVTGCATPQLKSLKKENLQIPRQAHIENVPLIVQSRNYCGPTSLAMALQWAGDSQASEEKIAPQVYTPGRKGTLQTDMIAAARRNRKLAVPISTLSGVLQEVAAGHPVIVLRNLGLSWYPVWHYSVVVGYDLDHEQLILNSGEAQPTIETISVFERTWARSQYWGLLVLPTNQLPVSVSENEVAKAAAALEDVVGVNVTVVIYKNILKRWPQNLEAHIGLANFYYNERQLPKMIHTLEQAVKFHPGAAPAWHNLALALQENKQISKAASAAQKALQTVSTQQKPTYLQNFREAGILFL